MKKISILAVLCIFFTLTLVLGIFVFPKNQKIFGSRTALLNPKYRDSSAYIEITQGDAGLILQKKGNIWTGTVLDFDILFPVDTAVIEIFFDEFCAERLVYEVSDRTASYGDYGLAEQQSLRVHIRGENAQLYSDVFFGSENLSAKEIFMRTSKNLSVYALHNTFYRVLSINADKWADMKLFPAAMGIIPANVSRIVIQNSQGSRVFVNSVSAAAAFDSYANVLFSARASAVVPFEPNGRLPEITITAEFAQGKRATLTLYNNGSSYTAVPDFLHYALEISSWTADRISGAGEP